MALKVIVHDNISQADTHVREWYDAKRRQFLRHPSTENVELYGIAQHTARYPNICDDCGKTFWANDPYAQHPKCRRGRAQAGF